MKENIVISIEKENPMITIERENGRNFKELSGSCHPQASPSCTSPYMVQIAGHTLFHQLQKFSP